MWIVQINMYFIKELRKITRGKPRPFLLFIYTVDILAYIKYKQKEKYI